MKIFLVAIGQRMPDWVAKGYQEYANRLPKDYQLLLKEVATKKSSQSPNPEHIQQQQTMALLNACPMFTFRIALDRQGQSINTEQLSLQLQRWHDLSQDIAVLVGGAEGMSASGLEQADAVWSLSRLTFAHPLVRVVIAEQIYRAWSILSHHPYHRK